ncbi:MAG: hypothetical protein ACKOC5_11540 [Chloroflexota bacterium]
MSLVLTLAAAILLIDVMLHIQAVQASVPAGESARRTLILTSTPANNTHRRFCGKLVFMVNYETGVGMAGLVPCSGSSVPLIFSQHPRDLVPFYQFRDLRIEKGDLICTEEHGCLDRYVAGFQNYIGIDSCSACGMNVPSTWTQIPLTPFTATSVPPTSTPYVPSPTPTLTATLAPWQVTATPEIFDLLRDTPSPSVPPSSTAAATPTVPPGGSVTPETPAAPPAQPGLSPLVLGIGFIAASLALAYGLWVWSMRERNE